MKLSNIKSAYSLCQNLYGLDIDEDTFEELAYEAWGRIGTKHTRLYRYIADVVNGKLDLPCNVDEIESVHIPVPDAQMTSNQEYNHWNTSVWTEAYIDAWNRMEDPYWTRGKLVKYDEGDNVLYFSRDYPKVMVVYHGIFVDEEDGAPLINDKERSAIAAFVAYYTIYKDSLKKRDVTSMKLAQTVKEDWLRRANAARVSEHFSQNDMNAILDVKTRWDRKWFGKSLKPIL